MTEMERQNIENEIAVYKQMLTNTDYRTLKHAEGELTDEEYAATKENRKAWRTRINELEEQLAQDGAGE